MEDELWFIIVALGPVALSAALVYAMRHRRMLSKAEKIRQEEAVEQLYEKPPGGREPTPERR